jgi:hypothetical protein
VPTTWFESSNTIPPQCLIYLTNTDGTRQISYTTAFPTCDNTWPFSSIFFWVRFQGSAGSVIIDSPMPPNYCGTVYTGWYAGLYPSTFYSTASSIACFNNGVNTCAACTPMKVTNCGTFYVFALLIKLFTLLIL